MIYQIILLSILFVFLYFFSQKIIKYLIYSPFYLYINFNLLTLILTILYYWLYEPKLNMFRLESRATHEEFLSLIRFHLIHLNAFVFGGLLIHKFTTKALRRKYLLKKLPVSVNIKFGDPKKIQRVGVFLTLSVVIIYFLVSGKAIFIREEYLPKSDSKALTLLAKLASLVAVFVLGISQKHNKLLANTLFFIVLIFNLNTGSRFNFILVILYVVLWYNYSKKNFINNTLFKVYIVLSLFFLAYVIQLRHVETHGLIPYLGFIFNSFDKIYENFIFNIYYMLIFGNYVTIDTIDRGLATWNTIFVSLNPLPGSMVGWYEYAPMLRINRYCPYSSHGEVFTMGILFTIIYYKMLGFMIMYLDIYFRRLMINKKYLIPIIILLFVGLHLVYGFEYNLRSSVRYIYYIFFILLMSKIVSLLLKGMKKKPG